MLLTHLKNFCPDFPCLTWQLAGQPYPCLEREHNLKTSTLLSATPLPCVGVMNKAHLPHAEGAEDSHNFLSHLTGGGNVWAQAHADMLDLWANHWKSWSCELRDKLHSVVKSKGVYTSLCFEVRIKTWKVIAAWPRNLLDGIDLGLINRTHPPWITKRYGSRPRPTPWRKRIGVCCFMGGNPVNGSI